MQNYLMSNYSQHPVYFARGEGSFLFDRDGKRYLDFGCGIAVTNLGHSNPHLNKCVQDQFPLWHTSNIFPNEIVEKLARRISQAAFEGKMFFCNSGAEANEAALKLARIFNNKIHNGEKNRVITMKGSFHGRTMATLSATGQSKIQTGFEPILRGYSYVGYNDIDELEKEMAKKDVAAVMLELCQGESGVLPATDDYIKAVRSLTIKHNALMIVDEVQTGFGRTGKLFAYQHTDVVPDAITMAKGIANGIPMGALLAKKEFACLFTPGTHASTFGGNLLATAAANGVMDILLSEGFLENVTDMGRFAVKLLNEKLGDYDIKVRGKGLMIGIVFPPNIKNSAVVSKCLEKGLVLVGAGQEAIRFYPVLNVSKDLVQEAVAILAKAIKEVMEESNE